MVVLACLGRGAVARAGGADAPSAAAQHLDDRVRHGLVLVEQRGSVVAVGTVLGRDGRVLTALSGLGGALGADLRYADGSTVHAQIGRSDEASDLALLVPQSYVSIEGLDASSVDPSGPGFHAMVPTQNGRFVSVQAEVRGNVAAHGQPGQPTVRMLELSVHAPAMAGAPLVDATGHVVAVVVHACKVVPVFPSGAPKGGGEPLPLPPPPCAPEPLGAPVSAIRFFLAGPSAGR
jgi:hypothetical protein